MSRQMYDRFRDAADRWNRGKWFPVGHATFSVANGVASVATRAGTGTHMYGYQLPPKTDYDVRLTVRRKDSTATQRVQIVLRSNMGFTGTNVITEDTNTCISLTFDHTGAATLRKIVNNTVTTLASGSTLLPATDTWYQVRLVADGTNIQAKVWLDGATEPGTWNYSVADDTTGVPAGIPEIIYYRSTATAVPMEFGPITVSRTGLRIKDAPRVYRYLDGSQVPNGRGPRSWTDQCIDAAQPAWMTVTGTLTSNQAGMYRQLTAAGNASATISTPAIEISRTKSIKISAKNWRSSTADTGITAGFNLLATGVTYSFTDTAGLQGATLTAGTSTRTTRYEFIGEEAGDVAPRHHNMSLLFLTEKRQLVAYEGDQIVGWLDFPGAPPSGNITPQMFVTATTSTSKTATFDFFDVTVERM